MSEAPNSGTDHYDIFVPHADLVFIIPFWISAIHRPVPRKDKRAFVGVLAVHLNSLSPPGGTRWREDMELYDTDPWRLQWLVGARLIGDVSPPQALLDALEGGLKDAGYADWISIRQPELPSIRYEEFGLGTIEYIVRFELNEGAPAGKWMHFLGDSKFWISVDMARPIENSELSIQSDWIALRDGFREALDKCEPAGRFFTLEEFIAPRFQKTPSQRPKKDGISWTYCFHLILYRKEDVLREAIDWPTLSATISRIGGVVDTTAPSYAKTHVPKLITDSGCLDVYYTGFSFVALVTEQPAPPATPATGQMKYPYSPARRIRALLRQFHLNYSAITESSHLLQEVIADTLRRRSTGALSDDDGQQSMRQIVATIAMVRYRSAKTNFESDDFETAVYGGAADAWGIEGADAALKMALDDADRVTTRDSETKREHEERRLNQLLVFLALLTTISVLQDFTQFVSGESPHAWEAGEALFRLFILFCVAFVAWRIVKRLTGCGKMQCLRSAL
jgi:hypothetical protein